MCADAPLWGVCGDVPYGVGGADGAGVEGPEGKRLTIGGGLGFTGTVADTAL